MRTGWMGICLARVYDSATTTTTCTKALITYISVNVPAPNVLAADLFGTYFSRTSRAIKQVLPCASLSLRLSPLPNRASFKIREMDCTWMYARMSDATNVSCQNSIHNFNTRRKHAKPERWFIMIVINGAQTGRLNGCNEINEFPSRTRVPSFPTHTASFVNLIVSWFIQ
jgi:hypothetical protein